MIDFSSAFPSSRKVYEERECALVTSGPVTRIQVPQREVSLSGGEAAVRLYDTSGPQGHDVREGLPKLREPWIAARSASGHGHPEPQAAPRLPKGIGTQLSYARKGEITPEMEFVSAREGLPAEFVRS